MRRLTTAIALAVLVAACGGNTAEKADEEEELSLGDFGLLNSPDDINPRAMEMRVQEKVAECMTAEGWEYKPYVSASGAGGLAFSEFDEEEYRKTYGFGISTQVLQLEEMLRSGGDETAADPNIEITKGMSEGELMAYNTALYGEAEETPSLEELESMTEEEAAEITVTRMSEPSGCWGEAWRQVNPGEAFFEEFGDALEDAFERASADPRVASAEKGWSACMAERGHMYASQREMYVYLFGDDPLSSESGEFQKRVKEVTDDFGARGAVTAITEVAPPGDGVEAPPGTAPGGDGVEVPPGTAPEGDGVEAPPGTAPPGDGVEVPPGAAPPGGEGIPKGEIDFGIDMKKLQPLIDEEISMAVADYQCGEDLRLIWDELYEEMERNFIDENRDRLLEFQKRNQ